MENLSLRNRGSKIDSKKLSALERLKKLRQGEKVEEEEEPEEEAYEYVEEDDYEEDEEDEEEYHSKKRSKNHHDSSSRNDSSKKSSSSSSRKHHLSRDKTSSALDDSNNGEEKNNNSDIRTAFFKAASKVDKKPTEVKKAELKLKDETDDFENEILKELNQKKAEKPARLKAAVLTRPTQIPFSMNTKITQSPAHKRKLSPNQHNNSTTACKKIELDDDLVQQLFETESNEDSTKSKTHLNNLTNTNLVQVKNEPLEFNSEVKLNDEKETLENIELLSQLTLDSSLSKYLDLPIKQEANSSATMQSEFDLSSLINSQAKNSDNLLMYWLDAYEEAFNTTGTVYLFGKMPVLNKSETNQLSFASVCCVVKNVPKVVYLLPRKFRESRCKSEADGSNEKEVGMEDVKNEITSLLERNRIFNYKTKVVKKFYAFDRRLGKSDLIPYEGSYLQVEYLCESAHVKPLPVDLEGETFSCVFGAQSSYLEHFLIELKIKGPCWLLMCNPKRREETSSMVSWCKVEYLVDNYKSISQYRELKMPNQPDISLPSTPPLTIMTLLLKTMLNTKTQEHEIICACALVSTKFYLDKATMPTTIKPLNQQQQQQQASLYENYFCALTKPSSGAFPYDFQSVLKTLQQKFRVEVCGSERALLAFLLCKMQSIDADILIGHDLFGFNLDILLNRCVAKKVPHWSRLGRLKRSNMPSMPNIKSHTATFNLITQQRIQTVCAGRLLCDVMLSAKELLTKCKSFDLNELAAHILFKKEPQPVRNFDEEKNVANFFNSSQLLLKFIQLSMSDATFIMRICNDLQCLQLAYQITCIAGNVLSRTLVGGRSERNEYLLLHAFHDKDFILPDKAGFGKKVDKVKVGKIGANKSVVKQETMVEDELVVSRMGGGEEEDDDLMTTVNNSKDKSIIKATQQQPTQQQHGSHNGYAGGLVLEPKIGFYDRFILLLDFNSLYPSIIQEYNICFTTISRPSSELAETDMDEYLENCIKLPGAEEKPGILPLEIRKLVDSRRQVKQLMQDKSLSTDLKMQYDIRQKALKLTANSVYGCLGFENSRFYCKPLAALITKNGRSILMKTKELVEGKKIEVIYGDTDSIMINTNLNDYDQVIKLGNMIKAEVNKLYKHLEIDIDGVFKCLLLLRKKKYAALTIVGRNPKDQTLQYQQEIKGLDVVRRDWCLLAKQIGERVIAEILSGQNCDLVLANINKILNETAEKIKNNLYDLSMYEISKQLNRNPEDYSDANHQSHVIVALRHNSDINNSKKFKSGDVVCYIICDDGTQNSSSQRAYSKSDLLKNSSTLKLDTKYYLTQQIHPVVSRLCEPIEGIDAFHIAESLGLDPAGFRHKSSSSSNQNQIAPPQLSKQQKKLENFMNEIEKYSNCVPFKYTCPNCRTETSWQLPFVKSSSQVKQEESVPDEYLAKNEDEEMEDDIKIDETQIVLKKAASTFAYSGNMKCILDACSNPTCKLKPYTKLAYIKNCLQMQINKFIKQYYQMWLVCEDPMCSFRTKRISCKFFHGKPQCIDCERYSTLLEYSHSDLYYQMKFFRFIFDSEAFKNYYKDDAADVSNLLRNKELSQALSQLKEFVNKKLKNNTYGAVNMGSLFKNF